MCPFVANRLWPHHTCYLSRPPSLSMGLSHSGLQSGFYHCLVDPLLIFLVDRFHSGDLLSEAVVCALLGPGEIAPVSEMHTGAGPE
ncbi:unnamed protein product [Protopolystoma xenopodis]|uniref:Uncharacterized protein n=1 Tax=Protopolystoma xenopodis TaxID=117903 RepID=A0A448XBR4_9PLAT|nr:unnamed protein product [Protopolystoma xenopodis]